MTSREEFIKWKGESRRKGLAICWEAFDAGWNALTKRVRELEAKIAALEAAIDAGGLDISPCLDCGTPVVTIPDGMTICDKCVDGANDQA